MEILEQTVIQSADVDKPAKNKVEIKIDDQEYIIQRGHHNVSELKHLANISQADVLEQLIHGKLVELENDGSVVIKGDEVFVSHPCDSASS